MNWLHEIKRDESKLVQCLNYYEKQYDIAKTKIDERGNIANRLAELPGLVEENFASLQMLESVLKYFEIRLNKVTAECYKKLKEHYNRELTSTDITRYINGEDDVYSYNIIVNDISLLRNKFIGIIKGYETQSYNLNTIARLRQAGLEDANF